MWTFVGKIFLLIFLISSTTLGLRVHAENQPQVPCYFIFGDSLSDAGNNNGLNTKAKANYPPYGVDFPGGLPTGRFTNGRTAVDFIAEHLGFEEYIPPFSTANGTQIIKGVNYASGSAGIRTDTGQHLGERISLPMQQRNHKKIIKKLDELLEGSVREHLHSCLYTVNIGSNDYINNYFMPHLYNSSRRYTTDKYAASLMRQYHRQMKILYKNGARKFALFGLGRVGCTLAEIIRFRPTDSICVDEINNAVHFFNVRLRSLVDQLNNELAGAKFTFINTQSVELGPPQGFTVFNASCCGVKEDYQCKEGTIPCEDRHGYIFWDGFHTTEAVNRFTGGRAYKGGHPLDAHPFDISYLVSL